MAQAGRDLFLFVNRALRRELPSEALLQVLSGQVREDRLIYVILAEDRLILPETKAAQPDNARPLFKVSDPVTRGVDQRKRSRAGHGCDTARLRLQAATQNLVRCNPIKHRPSQRVKLVVVCVPEAQISRILVIGVGVRRLPLSASVSSGLRRRNARRRQHDSR
jgi:hypothetical protein